MWPDLHLNITSLGSALSVLTAMITPALLISASGTFILSTTHRLSRVVDRMRMLSDRVEEFSHSTTAFELREERMLDWHRQIKQLRVRLRLLLKAMTLLYLASTTFVCTSVAVGVVAAVSLYLYWIPVALGILGACLLLGANVILIVEARRAVAGLESETAFLARLVRHHTQIEETGF